MMSGSKSLTDDTPDGGGTATPDRPFREAHVIVRESDFDTIGIGDLVSLWREAGLRAFEALACHEAGAVVQVEVERPLDGDRLASLECVDKWEHVSSLEDAQLYVIEFTAPNFPSCIADRKDEVIGPCDPELSERGVSISLVGPQEAIAELISECETNGMSPDLHRLGPYDGRGRPLAALTERQREVLRTAYEMGYYEVPRNVSSEEIAAEMDIGASTVAEHLQRAERNLLSQQLSSRR